ncbi:MAG: hypothetical protein IJ722_02135 [Alloprevotella sp.]|nr:hypothetical protein [Alloprevotella sp.]
MSPATYQGGHPADVHQTDAALRTAIACRQEGRPAPPAGMEERFMARLAKERSTGAEKPRHRAAIWITAAIAAAAAVAIAILPIPRTEADTAPGIASVERTAPAPVKETLPGTPEHTPAPARTINKVSPSPTPARTHPRPKPQVLIAATQPAPAPSVASPAPSVTSPSPVPSVATASQPQPAFTAEEIRLMERAEEMRPQALLYAAEILQCARIEARERQQAIFARQETSDHKQIITSI